MTEAQGEVFDLGYQHYEGPREGRMRARKAVLVNGVRTALGFGRGGRAKVLPGLLFVSAMSPAVILAIIASVPETRALDLPGHADYYQVVAIVLVLFSAIIAPELLCPDRRDGVISLYLVRPLTSTDYVAGRWLAFLLITLALVYSGQVVLLIGLVLSAPEPVDYFRDNWLDIPRILGAGLVVALFTTTLPLAVSAFTDRRAYAAAFVIGLSVISAPIAAGLTECDEGPVMRGTFQRVDSQGNWIVDGGPVIVNEETKIRGDITPGTEVAVHFEFGPGPPVALVIRRVDEPCEAAVGDAAKWVALIDLFRMPIHVSDMIFAKENESEISKHVRNLPSFVPIMWYVLLTAGPATVLWWRYRRIRL